MSAEYNRWRREYLEYVAQCEDDLEIPLPFEEWYVESGSQDADEVAESDDADYRDFNS